MVLWLVKIMNFLFSCIMTTLWRCALEWCTWEMGVLAGGARCRVLKGPLKTTKSTKAEWCSKAMVLCCEVVQCCDIVMCCEEWRSCVLRNCAWCCVVGRSCTLWNCAWCCGSKEVDTALEVKVWGEDWVWDLDSLYCVYFVCLYLLIFIPFFIYI